MTTQNSRIFGSVNTFEPSEILQAAPYSCAVKSQELILKMFGLNVTEEQLANEAICHGWYDPAGGTPLVHIGNLLELHGVDVEAKVDANVYDLMLQLAQGHQVIVTVDSYELMNPGFMSGLCDFINPKGVNHAIVVTGVDTTNPDDIRILVTDPGTGQPASYPVEQFKDAWEDSSFHMVHTTSAPLEHESLVNFMAQETQQQILDRFTPDFAGLDGMFEESRLMWDDYHDSLWHQIDMGYYTSCVPEVPLFDDAYCGDGVGVNDDMCVNNFDGEDESASVLVDFDCDMCDTECGDDVSLS